MRKAGVSVGQTAQRHMFNLIIAHVPEVLAFAFAVNR